MHDTDVTIYNRIKGATYEHDSYIPIVLHNTSVKYVYGAQTGTQGDTNADVVILSIMKQYLADAVYIKPKEYAAMIDHTGMFTLEKGDFFVIGDVQEESDMADFLSYMKEKYDDVHEILSVATYNLIPHWEVTAK